MRWSETYCLWVTSGYGRGRPRYETYQCESAFQMTLHSSDAFPGLDTHLERPVYPVGPHQKGKPASEAQASFSENVSTDAANCRPVFVRESKRRDDRDRCWLALLLAGTVALIAGCQRENKVSAPEVRPVRTIVAEKGNAGETLTLTGHIEAENEATLGFRIGGRVIERNVNVGDRVEPGQVLAKLDPTTELSALQSAEAGLAAARASLTQARNNFDRQRQLFQRGIISRAEQDRAQEALDVSSGSS